MIAWLASILNGEWAIVGGEWLTTNGKQWSVAGSRWSVDDSRPTAYHSPYTAYHSPFTVFRLPLTAYALILTLILAGGWLRLRLYPVADETMAVAGFTLPLADWVLQDEDELALVAVAHQDAVLSRSEQELVAGAQAVIWPEANVIVAAGDEAAFLAKAGRLAQRYGAFLNVAFWVLPDDYPDSLLRNQSVLLTPQGTVGWTYLKSIPVPGIEMSQPGSGVLPVMDTAAGRFSTAICYDMDFPSSYNRRVQPA